MSRFHSHINTAEKIISDYNGNKPFSIYVKDFFSKQKKYGSRDRKTISHFCYLFFRVANISKNAPIAEAIHKGLFLTENKIVEGLPGEWNLKISRTLSEKISFLGLKSEDFFSFPHLLSEQIDKQIYSSSLLVQSRFFLRIRPGKKEIVINKLNEAGIHFDFCSQDCLSLPPASVLQSVIHLDEEAVVQDRSSQQVFDFAVSQFLQQKKASLSVWDCCAGSGGKSILLYDKMLHPIKLTVTDVRENILYNLRNRFVRAGIKPLQSMVMDLQTGSTVKGPFDIIICDVPCSGSGTWGRTPEQMHFFKEKNLNIFTDRQKKIVSNAIDALGENGMFVYITCSVFKNENEDIAAYIAEHFAVKQLHMEYINGYDKGGDTLFTAVFSKTTA